MREMFSSISVPPRSLTPQRSASVAPSSPIFTQLACRLGIVRPSARRKAAVCLRFSPHRDLLDPVGAAEHRVEGDEAERDELGDAAGPLLQGADDAHVAGQLARLLDVAEHHRRGRAQAGAVGGFDDLDPAVDRELVRRDPLPDAVVEHLGRGPRRRAEPALEQVLEDLQRLLAGALAGPVDLHRRVGVQVQLRRRLLRQPQPAPVLLEASGRDGCRPACRARWRRTRPPRAIRAAKSSSETS